MLRALTLALGDLTDRAILAIVLQALIVTLAVFAILGMAIGWVLVGTDPCALVGGECVLGAGEGGIGAVLLTLLLAWLLFPGIAIGVVMGFADRISAIVEQRHYPETARAARPIGVGRAALLGLRSMLRILLFNLLALPFYLVLIVTGIGPFILFVIVNGLAFGRDLAEIVAARHGDAASRRVWLKSTRGEQGLLGTIVSTLFLVPFANLLAPVLGTAMAVHLYHRRQAEA